MSETILKDKFIFSEENYEKIQRIFSKYPPDRKKSASLPLLDLAQRQNGGWLSESALEAVAELIKEPAIFVKSVASFYTMFYLKPVGENVITVCKTLSCKLCGGDKIQEQIEKHLDIHLGETTEDNKFTLLSGECLGACVNAPMVQINDNYYEDLSEKDIIGILNQIKEGSQPKIGSYKDRVSSEGIK